MIIIFGAGLSGLSLARYLQAHKLPFRIFDGADEQKEQGYGLTLRQDTVERLMPVLGLSEAALRTAAAVDRKQGAMSTNLMDISTDEKLGAGAFKPEFVKDFRANRKRLRLTIQGYNGSVIAYFANGAQITGDLLVAADGIHSFVRTTLIPQVKVQAFPGVMYNGIRKMSIKDFESQIQPSLGSLTLQPGFGDSVLLAVTLYDIDPHEGTVYLSWAYTRRSKGADDPLFAPYSRQHNPSYAPPQLWEEIGNLPHPLVDPFQTILGDPDVSKDEVLHQLLVNVLIKREDLSDILRTQKVLFIGDAAHAWSNHAGTGGNNAIIDGLDLGKVLHEGRDLECFYNGSYQRWKENFDTNAIFLKT